MQGDRTLVVCNCMFVLTEEKCPNVSEESIQTTCTEKKDSDNDTRALYYLALLVVAHLHSCASGDVVKTCTYL